MSKTKIAVVVALVASTLTGCFFYSRPCHTECWWDHGRRVCERRCR